ncbi:MAG: hypothetical protein ABL866_07035 [Devosia sp.]
MGSPVPPANIPFLSGDNAGWLLTLAIVGVVIGSLATLIFRTPLFRSIMLCVILTIITALVLDWAGINLPFQSWARDFVNDTLGALSRFLKGLTNR